MNIKNLKTWQKVLLGFAILIVIAGIFADPDKEKASKTKADDEKSKVTVNQQKDSEVIEKTTKLKKTSKPMENKSRTETKPVVNADLNKENEDFASKIKNVLKSNGLEVCSFDKLIQSKKNEFTLAFNQKYPQYPGAEVEDTEYNAFLKKNVLEPNGLKDKDENFIVQVEQLAIKEKCHQK